MNGSISVKLDGEIVILNVEDKVTVPPRAKHTFIKHGGPEVRIFLPK